MELGNAVLGGTATGAGTVTAAACPVCGAVGAAEIWCDGEWHLVRCADCDLVYVSNPPDGERLAELYSFESGFHTQLAEGAPPEPHLDRDIGDRLRLMAAVGEPGRLLDVGCATGRFMTAAASQGWRVSGVELNDDTAEIGRRAGLDIATGTLESLDLPDASVDAVTMWDVVEHVPDPVALLQAAHRVLAPGGLLWLATPNVDGIFPKASLKVAARVGRWPHPEPPYHLCQFSERTIRDALARAGFAGGRVEVLHRRIPLSYTFGTPAKVLRDPLRLAYTAVFAPLAAAGPWLHSGDTLLLAARR